MDWSSWCCFESYRKWKMWKVNLHSWFLDYPSVPSVLYLLSFSYVHYLFLWLSEMLDGCRALLSIATVTTPFVFDQLLKSIRWSTERSLWLSNSFIIIILIYMVYQFDWILFHWNSGHLARFNCYLVWWAKL